MQTETRSHGLRIPAGDMGGSASAMITQVRAVRYELIPPTFPEPVGESVLRDGIEVVVMPEPDTDGGAILQHLPDPELPLLIAGIGGSARDSVPGPLPGARRAVGDVRSRRALAERGRRASHRRVRGGVRFTGRSKRASSPERDDLHGHCAQSAGRFRRRKGEVMVPSYRSGPRDFAAAVLAALAGLGLLRLLAGG